MRWLTRCALAAVLAASPSLSARAAPVVAAASDLQLALREVADRFARETGVRVTLVFGASGSLTRQLKDGAPFDVFLSADEAFVHDLADAGLARDHGLVYAIGRIALYAPRDSPLEVDERLDGIRRWLDSGRATRFAIANPEHAPYGRAAEAALRRAGLWERITPHLVLGVCVAPAARFAAAGDAAGGILAHSLVIGTPMAADGRHVVLPESLHPPLRQRMVLMKRAGPEALRFYEYLQGPAARDVLRRHGFTVPPV
jgi:molybdate transport system substrate-binding protein